MPPRKRAAAQPKETPQLEDPQAPAESTEESDVDSDPKVAPEDSDSPADGADDTTSEPTPPDDGSDDSETGEKPCAQCWPAGWPDDTTSLGCGHGSWNRDL